MDAVYTEKLYFPHRIGFLYDVGHAQTLDILGFYRHEDWLERFAPRIIGTHLHDVVGTTDHFAPGMGTVWILTWWLPTCPNMPSAPVNFRRSTTPNKSKLV